MTATWAETVRDSGGEGQGVARCDNCGLTSMARGLLPAKKDANDTVLTRFARIPDDELSWYPRVGSSPRFEDVPAHVAQAAKEAHSVSSINARMAAILMARTVIEATAKVKGIKTGNLFSKIDAMAEASIIRSDTKEAAHEIRHLGNDMAHGDIEDIPTSEEVADALILMGEILSEVFQGPARTARLKSKRVKDG